MLTKFPTGLAKSIMIRTETITAMTINQKALGKPLVIPIAVRMESKENTILISVICNTAFESDSFPD